MPPGKVPIGGGRGQQGEGEGLYMRPPLPTIVCVCVCGGLGGGREGQRLWNEKMENSPPTGPLWWPDRGRAVGGARSRSRSSRGGGRQMSANGL